MKRIHFITLSRSDYASLQPVARAADKDPEIDLTLVVGGSHLLQRFGDTARDIHKECYNRVKEIAFLHEEDNGDEDMAAAFARAVEKFVALFTIDRPEMVFIVGDRWEMMAVATAASLMRIPIAHHSGGDITQGSADNQARYVLSTLSHLHFVALEQHKQRLARMGEEGWRITVTGEPALTTIKDSAARVPDIYDSLGLSHGEEFVIATFHPTSYDGIDFDKQLDVFISALDMIEDTIILSAPNPDPGSGAFYKRMRDYAAAHSHVQFYESLGRDRYYAVLSKAKYMIGNSSSGIWEAPSFGLPVINLGRRQADRMRGSNVIDVPLDLNKIIPVLEKVNDPAFRKDLARMDNPYKRDDAVDLILSKLKTERTQEELLAKVFVDPMEG